LFLFIILISVGLLISYFLILGREWTIDDWREHIALGELGNSISLIYPYDIIPRKFDTSRVQAGEYFRYKITIYLKWRTSQITAREITLNGFIEYQFVENRKNESLLLLIVHSGIQRSPLEEDRMYCTEHILLFKNSGVPYQINITMSDLNGKLILRSLGTETIDGIPCNRYSITFVAPDYSWNGFLWVDSENFTLVKSDVAMFRETSVINQLILIPSEFKWSIVKTEKIEVPYGSFDSTVLLLTKKNIIIKIWANKDLKIPLKIFINRYIGKARGGYILYELEEFSG